MNSESLYACFLFAISNTWWTSRAGIKRKNPREVPGMIMQNAIISGITEKNESVFGLAYALQHSSR